MSMIGEKECGTNTRVRGEFSPLRAKGMLCENDIMEKQAVSWLRRSPYLEVRRVVCECHEGMLCLRGHVPSYYLKQIAQTVVLEMDGVDEILNQLEVVTPPDGL